MSETRSESPARKGLLGFRAFVRESTLTFRKSGFRGLLKAYGWKLFVAFVLFYLVRDVTLYIVLPYLAARGIWSLWD